VAARAKTPVTVQSASRARAEWNPRFEAYARAHGRSPEAMLEHDRKAWPGGCMTGFMLWIGEQWTAWLTPQDRKYGATTQRAKDILTAEDHAAFDAWLQKRHATGSPLACCGGRSSDPCCMLGGPDRRRV
jgi:hypothetical protein